MNRRLVTVLLLLGAVLISGCNNRPVMDYGRLVDGLGEAGATVEEIGDSQLPGAGEPIFSVTGKIIRVSGENTPILEYSNAVAAETETGFISRDGFDLTRLPDSKDEGFAVHVDWIASPHWYQAGRIIVLYVGENQKTLDMLENLLGTQFAGYGPARAAE